MARTEEGKRRRREAHLLYYHNNKDEPGFKEKRKIQYLRDRERQLKWNRQDRLKKNFGLSLEEYQDMFDKQDGVCAICEKTQDTRMLGVDHCHETGKVRGLLCGPCNSGLGMFKDNKETLKRALEYL